MDGHVARTCLKGGGAMLPIPSIAVVSGLRETIRLGEILRELLRQVLLPLQYIYMYIIMSTVLVQVPVGCAGVNIIIIGL